MVLKYGGKSAESATKQLGELLNEEWDEITDDEWSVFVKEAQIWREDMPHGYRPKDAADYLKLVMTYYNSSADDKYKFPSHVYVHHCDSPRHVCSLRVGSCLI